MSEHPSPEFEKELRETLGEPNANPIFVRDLRATLIERSTMKQKRSSFSRLAWGLAIAILLALLLVASPRAAAMFKQWLGYVTGVGFVRSDESLRVLAAPVTVNKAGIQVSIENGTVDSQHTILLQRIEGSIFPDPSSPRFCDSPARLILPDGTPVKEVSYGTSMTDNGGGYLGRYEFEALPAGQLDVVLEIPCVMYDSNFTDFKFDLHFKLADARQVLPVIELPTQVSASPSEALQTPPVTASVSPASASVEGFAIVLESETVLADGYILTGSYQWTDPRFDGFSAYPPVVQITDANGGEVNIEPMDPVVTNTDPAVKKLPFAFHVIGKDYAFPLTISVDSVIATLHDTATFQFDFGANPQVGQTWNTKIDVPIAGHTIHIQTIQLTPGRTSAELGFTFTMTSDADVTGATVVDANPVTGGGGRGSGSGGGGGGADGGYSVGPFTSGWAIAGYSPAGVKTFIVSDLSMIFRGNWQTTWSPSTP
jgi:hypothetical protein